MINFIIANAAINRTVEPIVLSAKTLPDRDDLLDGVALENIVLYSYNAAATTWTQIPVQIDEYNTAFGDNMQYFHPDAFFGEMDELVFMAAESGDKAPADALLDDVTTHIYPRYEFKIIDDISNDTGYVYLFRTDNPGAHTNNDNYVDWKDDPTRGELIVSDNYELGFDVHGHMSNLNIPVSQGGQGVDFFDRMKIRIVGNAELLGASIDVSISEDRIEGGGYTPNIIDGPLRVIRKWNFDVRVDEIGGYKFGPYDFLIKYYPRSADFGNSTFSLGGSIDVRIDYVRLSFDLNSNANGMRLFAPLITDQGSNYPDGVPIDRVNDVGVTPRTLNIPGWNWWMQTGAPGTMLTVSYLPKTGIYQYLYYKDDNGGTNDPGSAPTTDTGDNQSWGDTGFKVTGPLQDSSVPLGAQLFFLGPTISKDSANVIKNYKAVPLKVQVKQDDNIPPAIIDDLVISEIGDSFLTISWTAVGDDGKIGGPIAYYIIRYNTAPMGDDIWGWWASATDVAEPTPAQPGETQSVTIDDLDKNKMYYFAIRAVDEQFNPSPLSFVTLGTTTPVELVSFNAEAQKKGVELSWTTASENNNLGFAVQRRFNESDWQEISFVKGAGTSNKDVHYSFQDIPQQIGNVEYRLKQIDTDGSFELSDVVTVTIKAPAQFSLDQNWPNPFNPTTKISFNLPAAVEGHVELAVYDMLGRQVKSLFNQQAGPGFYSVEWDGLDDTGHQTSSGVYVYILQTAKFRAAKKMIKLQ